MDSPFDTYLVIAAIYFLIACLYVRPHCRIARILLPLAALALAACAAANSTHIREWQPYPARPVPTFIETRGGSPDFIPIAVYVAAKNLGHAPPPAA